MAGGFGLDAQRRERLRLGHAARTLQLRFGQGGGRYGFGFDRYKLDPKGFPQTHGLKHDTGVGGRRTPPYSFLYPLIILYNTYVGTCNFKKCIEKVENYAILVPPLPPFTRVVSVKSMSVVSPALQQTWLGHRGSASPQGLSS